MTTGSTVAESAARSTISTASRAYNTDTAPRMGDTVTGLTGVLDYQWAGNSSSGATWRIRAVEDGANEFEDANPRPAAPEDVGGTIQAGSFNVLNYFATLDDAVD